MNINIKGPFQIVDDDEKVLACPNCQCKYLHHAAVTVYPHRNKETVAVVVDAGPTHVVGENPSCDSNGIAIKFTCEQCNLDGELTIAQHKGQTFIEWRYT